MESSSSEPSPNPKHLISQKLKKIEEAVWQRRPILEDVVSKRSNKSLYEYAQGFIDINPVPGLAGRRPELIKAVERLLTERVGEKIAGEVSLQLTEFPLVSTADHHGPLNNPFFVNSNIISGIPYHSEGKNIKYLVDFSFASISINNSSYPRGIEFNSDRGGIVKIPLFPDKLKMGVAYATRAYTQEDLDRAILEIKHKQTEGHLTQDRCIKICNYLQNYYGNAQVLEATDFASQITRLNLLLWPTLFGNSDAGNLIYLEIETIVTDLLLNCHLRNSSGLVYKFLFDPLFQNLILKHFNNIDGAFSLETGRGSYMFWALDKKARRIGLHLQNGQLVSKDGLYKFTFSPDGISQALAAKQIFPGMLLCYWLVALYYGFKCLGGFSQVHDLTETKEAWIALLEELGENAEAAAVAPMQTKEYGGDGMLITYLPEKNDEPIPAYGLEMAIDPNRPSFQEYIEAAKHVTIAETIAPMMPEIYNVLYHQDERDPELATLHSSDIAKSIGLLGKLSF